MKEFAKIYETDETQILLMLDSGEDGPEVRLFFSPEGLGVCSAVYKFSDDEEGWNLAEEALNNLDKDKVSDIVSEMLINLRDIK